MSAVDRSSCKLCLLALQNYVPLRRASGARGLDPFRALRGPSSAVWPTRRAANSSVGATPLVSPCFSQDVPVGISQFIGSILHPRRLGLMSAADALCHAQRTATSWTGTVSPVLAASDQYGC